MIVLLFFKQGIVLSIIQCCRKQNVAGNICTLLEHDDGISLKGTEIKQACQKDNNISKQSLFSQWNRDTFSHDDKHIGWLWLLSLICQLGHSEQLQRDESRV